MNSNPTMARSRSIIFLILSIFAALTPAVHVDCVSDGPLAPLQDCNDLVKALDLFSRNPLLNKPKRWGRTVPEHPKDLRNEEQHLPEAFFRKFYPPARPDKCQVVLDNARGREGEVDVFNVQQLVNAAKEILLKCYPQGKTGYAYPLNGGSVFVTAKYRSGPIVDQLGGEGSGIGIGGDDVVVADVESAEAAGVVDLDPALTERRWIG